MASSLLSRSPLSMSTASECPKPVEIDAGEDVYAVIFTANGEHLVSGSKKGVRVWRVKDGKHTATMPMKSCFCVAASNDGRWIAGGTTSRGEVTVWDTVTYGQVFSGTLGSDGIKATTVLDVDFSPDSTHLVSADGALGTATIWDVEAHQKVRTLNHNEPSQFVRAAKYSPQGDRIATATDESVRVWDSHDGHLLLEIQVLVKGWRDLLWYNDHLLVQSKDSTIKKIDPTTGSTISEWPVPDTDSYSCIALPQHGKFIACSTKKTITFLDAASHTQLSPIQHTHDIHSIACSAGGQLLAFAAERKIIVKGISSLIFPFVSDPDVHIDIAALDAWKRGRLTDAEALLSAAISSSVNQDYHAFAGRSLVRAGLGDWEAAIVDAEESEKIQPSVIGYIAKCVALVGSGEIHSGCRVCDIAFLRFPSHHVSLLLLVKAVVLFMAGERVDAISRMNDLITDAWVDPALYVVQAYMHLYCGNLHMESGNYKRAIQSFENGQIKLGNRTGQPPLIVSLISGWKFDDIAVTIEQRRCEALLASGSVTEASDAILRFVNQHTNIIEPIKAWVSDFKHRCSRRLEDLGDSAMDAKQYDTALSHYTTALSLDPASPQDLLVKRSKVWAENGKWEDALDDANEAIKLDPSSPSGYKRKYIALLGLGHDDGATDAFEIMLSKMSESSDPGIREQSRRYVRPEQTKKAIRTSIKNAIRNSPPVLINTLSGRLCNKSEQATAFESTPSFTTLIGSMTAHIDRALIDKVVGEFYRYATFSHTWEGDEPLYDKVIKVVVYDLEAFPTHEKLQMFCKIVRDEGFIWAWSDTCCIDKEDHFVLQEALVMMFKWYEGSAMTIIFLCDVDRLAEIGALTMSIWNSRGWTLQEYHASKVVRIYTKDWTPYLGLTIYNHKESPEIISEMEKATGISAQSLMALRPGLNDIREKLRLASTRQTTRVEDAAYSLLGIFSMTLPVTYGEGDQALGRLLSQLLMSTGDTSILAWTGISGSFNSCLPTNICVFSQPLTSYIPPAVTDAEVGMITTQLLAASLDLNLATRLYERLEELPTPLFGGQRMKLPCLAFKIKTLSRLQNGSETIFRAHVDALGPVEIKTEKNLMKLDSLYLAHPWIDFLLDRRSSIVETPIEDGSSELDKFPSRDSFRELSTTPLANTASLPSSSTLDTCIHVYQFLARLRRSFGALLLTPTRQNAYKRVASESLISVQVEDITAAKLEGLIQSVRVLDVL